MKQSCENIGEKKARTKADRKNESHSILLTNREKNSKRPLPSKYRSLREQGKQTQCKQKTL